MVRSESRVATTNGARYVAQLCKHFAHKIAVEHDGARGRAEFPFGICHMEVDETTLVMRCEAADAADLERLQGVMAVHFERFAWREKAAVAWVPVQSSGE